MKHIVDTDAIAADLNTLEDMDYTITMLRAIVFESRPGGVNPPHTGKRAAKRLELQLNERTRLRLLTALAIETLGTVQEMLTAKDRPIPGVRAHELRARLSEIDAQAEEEREAQAEFERQKAGPTYDAAPVPAPAPVEF